MIKTKKIKAAYALALAAAAVSLLAGLASPAVATPVFVTGLTSNSYGTPTLGSGVQYIHDDHISAGTLDPHKETDTIQNTATPTANYSHTFNSTNSVFSSNSGSSVARGGIGHKEDQFNANIVFASGMGVSQTDPAPEASPGSRLTVNFRLTWNIDTLGFGEPILGTFKIPVAFSVGAGGYGEFRYDVHWDIKYNGETFNDARTPFSSETDYPMNGYYRINNNTSSTINSVKVFSATSELLDATPVTGSFLLPQGAQVILRGKLIFTSENLNGPVSLGIADPTDTELEYLLTDDCGCGKLVLDEFGNPIIKNRGTDPVGEALGAASVPVPLPSTLAGGGILLAGVLANRRRRAAN